MLHLFVNKLKRSDVSLIVFGFATIVAVAFFVTTSLTARAAQGLTVEIERPSYNLVVAQATTVEGAEVVEGSWRWARISEDAECSVDTFGSKKDAVLESGDGWTKQLTMEDVGSVYCFYAEDSKKNKAVGGLKIARLVVKIALEGGNKLVARATYSNVKGVEVDSDTWSWFRYKRIAGSRFGCEEHNHGLKNEQELKGAAKVAEAKQDKGSTHDVYEQQKDVYQTGKGNLVALTKEDVGLSYCFRVVDKLGVDNSQSFMVDDIDDNQLSANDVGQKPSDVSGTAQSGDSNVQAGNNQVGSNNQVGQVGGDTKTVVDEGSSTGTSNAMRNIGVFLLVVAVIVAVVMLIQKTREGDADESFDSEED